MDDREPDALCEHFDTTDLADAIDSATWETAVASDPMIVTSVRLPKSLLDWVREQASTEHLKPTALIRRWIEDRRRASAGERNGAEEASVARLAARVSRLEAIALRVASTEPDTDGDSMADLLAALQASVDAAQTKGVSQRQDQERRGA